VKNIKLEGRQLVSKQTLRQKMNEFEDMKDTKNFVLWPMRTQNYFSRYPNELDSSSQDERKGNEVDSYF
jgi:hypothetical protein